MRHAAIVTDSRLWIADTKDRQANPSNSSRPLDPRVLGTGAKDLTISIDLLL